MESSNPRAGRKSRKLGSRRRHQMKEVADEDGPPALDSDWPSQATEELQDFFRECGAEQKGFITREDLRKAKFSFLGNPEELELIFEWLDPERKGSLTIKEFTSGLKNVFSSQTRIPGSRKKKPRTWVFSKEEPTSFQRLEEVDPEERRWFLSFMEQLGTDHLSLDQAEIWQLWKKLRQEEPHLVGNLEGFLAKVTSRLQETQAEKETLQMTLKKYDDDHHREVQQLYEEMEHQIHSEKQRLQAASDTQGLAYSSMMHQALEAKEREMQYLAEGQRELEAQIDLLKSKRHEVSLENQRLQETQRDLTGQLEQVQGQLQVTRGHLNLARGQVAWQVEEETSLSSGPPVDPKNTSDSQHFTSFPEEDPLPSLFEEGDWSQLLSNFTSPLSGNTTQISWSPPPTPTSLKGYHTPRIVRQISITKQNSWQFNQESPSDPEVLPRSPLGSSEAPAVVLELKVAGEPKPGKTFQLDFQKVSSGEPAITTWGQAAPELGDSLASSDSLPSQELAGPGKGFGETDGDEVGQGDGPISDILSKGPSSEESLQTLGPSADMQADTWKVGAKEIPHPGLPPAGSEQEVGSWGKEVFTLGSDVPVESPEHLVLIEEGIPMMEKEQEKMNTEGWEMETNQQNDVRGLETELRESAGSVVSEVPGEESKSTQSPGPDVGEILGEGYRSTESPGPDADEILGEGSQSTELPGLDVGEVPREESRNVELPGPDAGEILGEGYRSTESPGPDDGEVLVEDSRFTKSPGPDVENALSQKAELTDSPGPDIGNPDAQETSHVVSSRTVVDSVLSQEEQILRSLESDVEKVPGQKSQLIHLVRVIELPGTVIGNATEKKSELMMSPREDTDNAFGQKEGMDVGNVLCEEAGILESAELERDNHPGQEIGLLSSSSPDVDVYPSYEVTLLKSYQPGVGDTTELHRLTVRNASDHEARIRISPEIDTSSQEAGLTGSPGPDEDDVSGHRTRFMESWKIDIKDASGKEAQVLYSPEPEVGETFRQENVFMSSLGPDRADVTGQKVGTGIGDAAIQEAGTTELCKDDVRNASDQGSELMESPELHVDDTVSQENGFIQSDKTDTEKISEQEVEILYSPGLDSSNAPGQGAGYIESPESDVSDVAVQAAGLMNSSVIDSADSPSQEDKLMLPEKEVSLSAIQKSDIESGLDVGNSPSQETRHDIGGTFLYSPGPDTGDTLSQETRHTEPTMMDVDDATVQRPGVIELSKVDVGHVSDQENRLIKSSGIDAPIGKIELIEFSGPEMGDALSQEIKFGGLCEMDVGDVEMAEIMYSPVPDIRDSLGQKSGVVELHELCVSEISIQQARVLESDVRDGPGQGIMPKEFHEADVGNASAQDTEIIHSPRPGVRDSAGLEAETVHSPGPYVGDSIGQETGVQELDVGNASDQEARFMPSSETHVSGACEEEAEILHSPGPDEEDSPGQEGEPKESSMLDLGEAPGQEGSILEISETGVDIGSSQQTRETESPGPSGNEAPGQEAGIGEPYEADMRDALGNEIDFGPDGGDAASNEGILMLETQQSDVSDASNSGQVVEFIESCGPEVGDISHQEAEIMNSPGSDRCDAFRQETMFMELGETDVGNAEITYSPVPDMSESLGQEVKVLESPETDVRDGLSQEVMTSELYEADVENASAQDTEIMHSPRPGVRDSAGPEAETVHLPGPYGGDFIGQEAGVPEVHRDVGNASDQETRFMPSFETYVSGACEEEIEILHSPGPDVGDAASNEGILMLKTQQSNMSEAFNSGQVVEFIESCGPEVGDVSHQEAEIMNSLDSDRCDAFHQETMFMEQGETDVGNAEITYSPFPDMNESLGQEVRVLESPETDVRDGLGQEVMTRESYEADVGNASAQDTEIMPSPKPGVRDSAGPEAEIVHSPGPYGGDSIGQETGVPEVHRDVGNASDQETRFMPSSETHVSDVATQGAGNRELCMVLGEDIPDQETEIMHSPGPDGEDSSGQEHDPKESSMLDLGGTPSQEGSFLELSETGVDIGSSQQTRETESPGPNGNEAPGQEAGIGETYETDMRDALDNEVEFGPDVGDAASNEGILMLETQQSDVSDAFNSDQVLEFIESCGPEVGDSSHQETEIMNSPGSDRCDAFRQETMFMELGETDVGNAEITYSPIPDISESLGQEVRVLESTETDVRDGLSQEVMTRESYEADVENASAQDTEIMHSPRPGVRDSAGPEAETVHSPGPYGGDFIGQEAGVPELDVGNAPDQEARFMPSSETHVSGACEEAAEILHSPGPYEEDSLGQETEPKESSMLDLGGAPGQEGSFLELSEAGVDTGSSQQTRETGSPGPNGNEAPGQEAGIGEPYETDMSDALDNEVEFGPDVGDAASNEGILMLETQESDVSDASNSGQVVEFIESCGPEAGDISHQEAEIMHSTGPYVEDSIGQEAGVPEVHRDVRNAPDQEARFMPSFETHVSGACEEEVEILHSPGPDVGDAASNEGILMLKTQQSNMSEAFNSGQVVEFIESCGPEVGDVSHQEAEIMNSLDSDRCDAFHQETMFMEQGETDVGNAEITYSPFPDMNESLGQEVRVLESPETDVRDGLGQEVMTRESYEADVGNASAQDTEIMPSPKPGVRDSAGPEAEIVHSPGPYGGDSIGQETGVPEVHRDVGNASDQETRFMPSSETHVSDVATQGAGNRELCMVLGEDIPDQETEIMHSPGPDGEDSSGQEHDPKESSMLDLGGTPSQEGSFLELSETGVDIGSSQQTRETESPGPNGNEAPGQEAGIGETYETDMRDALDNEVEFGPDVGDAASNEGILMLETQQSDVSDAFNSDQVLEFIESCGPEVGDSSHQETEIMNSPGSDRCDAFRQETMFMELGETDVGNAEITYSPIPDISESLGQEVRVLESTETDVRDGLSQEVMTRESYEADVENASAQDTEIMHSPRPGVRDSAGPEAETVHSPGPYGGDFIGQEAGVPELDVGNAPDQEARFMPSSETHVSGACEEAAEILHSPGPYEEDSLGQETEPKESSMLDLGGAPGQEGSFLELSEAGVDTGSSQQTRETGSPGPNGNEAPGQEAGIGEPYETDMSDALDNEVEFGPDVGDAASNEGILMLETQESDVSDASNSGQVVEFIESCGPEAGDISHQEAEIMHSTGPYVEDSIGQEAGVPEVHRDVRNAPDQEARFMPSFETHVSGACEEEVEILHSPGPDVGDAASNEGILMLKTQQSNMSEAFNSGQVVEFIESCGPEVGDVSHQEAEIMNSLDSDRCDAFHQETMFMEQGETDVGNAEITYSPFPDMSESLGQEVRVLESPETDVRDGLGQEVMTRESYEADVGNASAQDTEIMPLPRPGVRDSAGPEAETVHLPGPYGGDFIVQKAGVPELDVGNAPDQEARFMPSSETHVSGACEEAAEILHSPGPYEEDSLGQETEPKESSMLDLGGAPGQEGSFLELSEAGAEDVFNHQVEQTGSLGSGVRDILGQEAEFKKSYEIEEEDTLGLEQPTVLEETASQEISFLESPEEGVENGSRQQTGQIRSPGPDVEDAPDQKAEIRESYETDVRDALDEEGEFDPDVGHVAAGQGTLMLGTQEPDVDDASRIDQITGFIESCGPEVGDISHQEAEIMNSPGSDRCDAFRQETMFMELGETDVGNAEITYSPVPDMSESLGQEVKVLEYPETDVRDGPGQQVMTRESYEVDVGNAPDQATEIMYSPRAGVRDSAGPEAETVHSPGPYGGDFIGQKAGVPELDVGNAPDQEARFMPSSKTHVSGACEEEAEILHSPGPDGEDSLVQETEPKESSMLDLEGAPGHEGSFLELSETGVDIGSSQQTRETESSGSGVRDILGQEAEFKKSCEIYEEDTLGLVQPTVLEEIASQEGSFLESPKEGVDTGSSRQTREEESPGPNGNETPSQEAEIGKPYETDMRDALGNEIDFGPDGGDAASNEGILMLETQQSDVSDASNSGQVVEFIESCGPEAGDISHQEAEIMHSTGPYVEDSIGQEAGVPEVHRDVRNAPDQEARFMPSFETHVSGACEEEVEILHSPGPDVGDAASNEGILMLKTQQSNMSEAFNSGQVVEFIESCGPEVGDVSHQEAEIMNSLDSDRCDAFHQETMFMEQGETDVGNAEITYSPFPDMNESLGQEVRVLESPETDVRDGLGQEVMTRESYEADVGNASAQDTEIMPSPKPGVRDSAGPEAEIVHSPGPYGGDSIGQETGVPEVHRDVGNASDQETRFMPSSETHVSDVATQGAGNRELCMVLGEDIPDQETEIMHSPGPDGEDSSGQEHDPKESSMLDLGGTPSQEGSFLELSETGVDIGSSQQTRETESPGPNGNEAPGQEAGIGETYETDMRDALDNEVEFGPDVGDAASNEGILMLETQQSDVSDAFNSDQVLEFIESCGPEVGDSSHQETEIMNSPGSDRCDAFRQETMFMELGETDVGNAEITYSPIPDISESLGQEVRVLESTETDVRDGLSQEVMTRESYEADVENASAQDTEIMHSPRPGVRDSAGPEAETVHSPGPYGGDFIGQEAGVPELDVGNAPDQEARFMPSSETHVSGACEEAAEILHSPGPYEEDSLGQETEPKESSMLDLGGAPGQEGSFLELSEAGVDTGSSQQTRETGSPGPNGNEAPGQEAGIGEPYETDMSDALDNEVEFGPDVGDAASNEGILMLETQESDVSDASNSGQVVEFIESCGPEAGDISHQEAEIMHSTGPYVEDSIGQEAGVPEVHRDVRNAPDQEARFMPSFETHVSGACEEEVEILHSPGPDVGDAASNEGILMLKTQQSNMSEAFNSGQVVEFIESCGPEVGDVSHQEAEIMNSLDSDRCDAFHQETMFMEQGETDVGNAEITYSPFPDMSESLGQEVRVLESPETDVRDGLGQEVMTRESYEADVGNASAQDTEIMPLPRPGVRDSAGPEAETVHLPGPYGGDFIVQKAGVPELDVGNAPDQEARFMPSSETHVSGACEEAAEILHSPGPYEEDSLGQETEPKESSMLDLGGAPGQEGSFLELSEAGAEDVFNHQVEQTGSLGSGVRDILGQEAEFKKSYEIEEEDTLGLEQPTVLEETASQEISFLESPEEGVENGSRQQTGQIRSPGPDVEDAPDQKAEIRESYETDVRDALDEEGEFDPDVGHVAAGQGTLMLGTQEPDVDDASRIDQITGFIESCGPEVGDISHQEAEIMNSPGSDRCDAFRQETMFMELGETDVGNAEITYSPVPDMSESLGQEVKVLEYPETDVRDGPGQQVMTRESYEVDVGNAPDQATEIMYSPRAGVRDSAGPEAETVHSPGPYGGDFIGQKAGVPELDVGNAPDQEARFMPSSKTHVSGACEEEAEILHSPGPDGEDSLVQETEPKESSMLDLEGAPGHEGSFLELSETGVDIGSSQQTRETESSGSGVRDILGQEAEFKKSCEIYEEDTLGLVQPTVLEEIASQEGSFLESPKEGVDTGSSRQTREEESPGPNGNETPSQEAEIGKPYETDMRDALGNEIDFGPDGGDAASNEGILMLETQQSDVSDASNSGQVVEFIESCGPEVGDSSHQEAEIMNSLGSDRCDAFRQETMFMERGETDVGNAEIIYSPVPDMSEFLGQEVRVLESPETDVRDGLDQGIMTKESHEADMENASAQDTEIMHSPRAGVRDSAGSEAETVHSPGPYGGDSIGQEAGVPELDVGNASDQEARFMLSSETHVSDVASQGAGNRELRMVLREDIPDQEAEILHLPGPDGEDSPGQEAALGPSPVQVLEGVPIQESRFLELAEAGVQDWSCKQAGLPGSPAPDVRDTPVKETEILHSPNRVVSDYPHQGTDRLIDSFRPVIDILSDEEVQLPKSSGPRVGDAPEEEPGNVESPRPDVLPVVPERGGLQDQNSEAVWRAEDGVLQRQAREGSWLPKDSPGDTLGTQDAGQALSVPLEAEVQPECKVLGGQIIPLSQPREENSLEVMKKANLKSQVQATGVSPGGEAPEPDYLFHVLFLGDSNVGKTSFLHLLHHDSFATGLTATVGMDYRIKNLMVDNRWFALQLWDTAGQERYHSITKQFLRKADGIVLMYDVTCPGSFTHVRYWLDCIQERGPDDVVILLLGNKIDCVKERLVSTEAGQLLAKEIGVIFGECSAVLGHNILEPIMSLARAMQEQDTKMKHSVVKLEKKEVKKAGCCS